MLFQYAIVLAFLVFGVVFVFASILVSRILAPNLPNPEKATPYECGEVPVGSPWIRFNPRFYLYALIFLIFEVEIAFVLPTFVIFRDWVEQGLGGIALIEILIFVFVLLVGFVYVWRTGALEWIRMLTDGKE